MFQGNQTIKINQNINKVFTFYKESLVKFICSHRSEVETLEKNDNFIKLKISDVVLGKKRTWIFNTYFDNEKKTIKYFQSEGPLLGMVSMWYLIKIDEKKTQINVVYNFDDFKKFPIFKNLLCRLIYKTQIEPVVCKRLKTLKLEAESLNKD